MYNAQYVAHEHQTLLGSSEFLNMPQWRSTVRRWGQEKGLPPYVDGVISAAPPPSPQSVPPLNHTLATTAFRTRGYRCHCILSGKLSHSSRCQLWR
jgi:hypothetical protein